MTIDENITDGKLQNGINRETAIISTILSGKIDKYEYLASGEILPSDQSQTMQ